MYECDLNGPIAKSISIPLVTMHENVSNDKRNAHENFQMRAYLAAAAIVRDG